MKSATIRGLRAGRGSGRHLSSRRSSTLRRTIWDSSSCAVSATGFGWAKVRSYSKYREIMLTAASTLAKRFNPKVGCLESNWDKMKIENSFPVIIDIMMNLELLFWASENGGPSYYADYARSHALTTCRDFVRPDGSTYHIVRYDKNTGKVINKGTIQGAGDETTWSRGHAWGLYGMVVAYRYTKDKRFLDTAMRLSDYFPETFGGRPCRTLGFSIRDQASGCFCHLHCDIWPL